MNKSSRNYIVTKTAAVSTASPRLLVVRCISNTAAREHGGGDDDDDDDEEDDDDDDGGSVLHRPVNRLASNTANVANGTTPTTTMHTSAACACVQVCTTSMCALLLDWDGLGWDG